jgi:hypothetical protein
MAAFSVSNRISVPFVNISNSQIPPHYLKLLSPLITSDYMPRIHLVEPDYKLHII